jgi:hypothetical protein
LLTVQQSDRVFRCRGAQGQVGSGEPLAVNALGGATLASMAVAPKSLFIRTATHLYRLAQL